MANVERRGRFLFGPSILGWMLLGWMLLASSPPAFALNPALDVSQYAHTSWKNREGFSKGRIDAIAQTRDGYLWLGTEFGLLRFDGVRVVRWEPPADQHLPSSVIINLLAGSDGSLWIGTDKGLASLKDGRVTLYSQVGEEFVFALLEDRDGAVWVGSYSFDAVLKKNLFVIHNGSIESLGEGRSVGAGVLNLYEDKRGFIWASGSGGIWRLKPGPPEFFQVPGFVPGKQILAEDFDGALLIGTEVGIKRLIDGKIQAYVLPDFAQPLRALTVFRDRDGGLWIGTPNRGITHVHQGRTDVFAASDGLSSDFVSSFFEDSEGNIWVATLNGLDRFREFAVPAFTRKQGLSSYEDLSSVLVVRDGSLLVAAGDGLNRWNNGQFTAVGAGTRRLDVPRSLFQDSHGRIWAVSIDQFGYLENDRFIAITGIPAGVVRGIVEDAAGDLWIANQNLGLFHLRGSQIIEQIPWIKFGHRDFAASLAFDPVRGGVWIGFFKGGLTYFKDGSVQSSYSTDNGLGKGLVNDLRVDSDGALFVATEGGLSRLKNNHFATLTNSNGLPCDTIHWLIEDDDHSLWLNTTCGLVRITRVEWDRWAAAADTGEDTKVKVQATVFDMSDGVSSRSYPIGFVPQVAKSKDGKLWFPSYDGVSVVDPRHLPFNNLLPLVHVEQLIANHQTYDTTLDVGRVRLPSLIRDLEIDYTALSLVAPEKVFFRYKLEGFDQDWQDAGSRRQAFYTNLPPRSYRFRVMACNNCGVWNEVGTFLDFSIAPAYYQTIWFRLACVAAFLVMLAAVYKLRVRQVARTVQGRMEGRLDERERIARDLHDTLLQSVQGLILKIHAIAKRTRDEGSRDDLEKALDRADEVLAEGRDRVRSLRGAMDSLCDLPAAFKRVAEDNQALRRVTFKTVVEGSSRELHPLVLEESFCIGREAVINALTHSKGHHVEVEITYEPKQFRLRVRDDGHGFDPKILEDGGRPGHWGLQGMRERSDRIGAQLKIWSGYETGTEIELIVPGAAAYSAVSAGPRNSLFRRSSGSNGDPR